MLAPELGARATNGPVPNHYQEAIFDFAVGGQGHGIVDAVAGAGKTTTLIGVAERVEGRRRFLSFNKHIVEHLKDRLPRGAAASTFHGLGYATLAREGYGTNVDKKKYDRVTSAYLAERYPTASRERLAQLGDVLGDLVRMARLTLTDTTSPADLRQMALDYDLELGDASTWQAAADCVDPVLECGRRLARGALDVGRVVSAAEQGRELPWPEPSKAGVIDFADMTWLPLAEGLAPPQAAYVLVDEAQDMNRCWLAFVLRACPRDGRLLFVGDRRQAIYAFSGADARSMERIEALTSATRLPLSICYRCPRSHVALAAAVYPGIEPAPGAPAGVIEANVDEGDAIARMQPGDLVLCRTNAPLADLCYRIIRMGKPAKVRGHDFGGRLIAILKRLEKLPGYTWSGFPGHLERYEVDRLDELTRQEADEMAAQSVHDKCETLRVIYRAQQPQSMQEMKAAVEVLFPEEVNRPVIWLSSVHRAKGDEAERVFLLRPDLLPHPKAKSPVQAAQERNLLYVALTRAKQALYIVDGSVPLGRTA